MADTLVLETSAARRESSNLSLGTNIASAPLAQLEEARGLRLRKSWFESRVGHHLLSENALQVMGTDNWTQGLPEERLAVSPESQT